MTIAHTYAPSRWNAFHDDSPIRLILVDDHDLFREGTKALFKGSPQYSIVGEARNGGEAVQMAQKIPHDVILMDIYMPGVNGIEATAALHASGCHSKIVGLSACGDQKIIRRLLLAGAAAFVSKRSSFQELCRAITATYANHPYHAAAIPQFTGELAIPNAGKLSEREHETLQLVTAGKSSKDIAETLGVCIKTIESHRRSLRRKLGLSSIAELTRYAIQQDAHIH